MNILPKKNWHVRKKENIARVRRDEAQAAEEEKERERRQLLAQQESRTNHLRAIAKSRREDIEPSTSIDSSLAVQERLPEQHINFFKDIEEGQKDVRTNDEHEREKKEEKEKAEKDIGLLTYLGQTTLDNKGVIPWYHKPERPEPSSEGKRPVTKEVDVRKKRSLDPMTSMEKYLDMKYRADHSGEKRSKESNPPSKPATAKRKSASKSVEQLRAERLERERQERKRQDQLLQKVYSPPEGDRQVEERRDERSVRYNSQFNPDLVRVKRRRYNQDEF